MSAVDTYLADDLTVEQVEDILAVKRLQQEQELLTDSLNTVSALSASTAEVGAVGPTLFLNVLVEGVEVEAVVDIGSQTTIISRRLLHSISQSMSRQGRSPPPLSRPVIKLYGKDGKRELVISAQTKITIEADGKSACVPVFVQPDSEQDCLLGMNALPSLGLSFRRANGEPLICKYNQSVSACVCLIQTTRVPGGMGKFVEAKVDTNMLPGTHMVFEPEPGILESRGLSAQESLLTISPDCRVLVPVQNFQKAPVELKEGMKLGMIETVYQSPETVQKSEPSVRCAPVRLGDSGKQKELLACLKLPEHTLTAEQSDQFQKLLRVC